MQATIVRKLSSYVRQNQACGISTTAAAPCTSSTSSTMSTTKRAKGPEGPELRGSVSPVSQGSRLRQWGNFRVHTEAEQQIGNGCSRPIADVIIFYNRALRLKVYTQ